MHTDTVFPLGSVMAEALHSVSTVESPTLKETFVSDCLLGEGPGNMDKGNINTH